MYKKQLKIVGYYNTTGGHIINFLSYNSVIDQKKHSNAHEYIPSSRLKDSLLVGRVSTSLCRVGPSLTCQTWAVDMLLM